MGVSGKSGGGGGWWHGDGYVHHGHGTLIGIMKVKPPLYERRIPALSFPLAGLSVQLLEVRMLQRNEGAGRGGGASYGHVASRYHGRYLSVDPGRGSFPRAAARLVPSR